MKSNQDIGAALKSKLRDLTYSPDNLVWDHIEKKLKRKRRRLLFWFLGAGLLLVLVMLLWFINPFQNTIENSNVIIDSSTKNDTLLEKSPTSSNTESSTNLTEIEFKNINERVVLNDSTALDGSRAKIIKNDDQKKIQNPKNNSNENIKSSANKTTLSSSKNAQYQTNNELNKNSKQTQVSINNNETEDNLSDNLKRTQNLNKTKKVSSIRPISKLLPIGKPNEQTKDSLMALSQNSKLISEENQKKPSPKNIKKTKDSLLDELPRWTIYPHIINSNYRSFNDNTKDNYTLNYGVLFGFRSTEKTFLRFGLRYFDLKHTIASVDYKVSYIEFPLDVKYVFTNERINPFINGGVSHLKFIEATSNNSTNLGYGDTFSINVGLGAEVELIKNFYFNLESIFNYHIKPFSKNTNYQPYIISINTGIEYRF